jgi:PAS domain S-box-containing protein
LVGALVEAQAEMTLRFFIRVKRWFVRLLVEPGRGLVTEQERHEARLTALTALLLAALGLLDLGAHLLLSAPVKTDTVIALLIILAIYPLTRTRLHKHAAAFIVAFYALAPFVTHALQTINGLSVTIIPIEWSLLALVVAFFQFSWQVVAGTAVLLALTVSALYVSQGIKAQAGFPSAYVAIGILISGGAYQHHQWRARVKRERQMPEALYGDYKQISEMLSNYAFRVTHDPERGSSFVRLLGEDTLFGYPPEKFLTNPIDYIHPDDRAMAAENLALATSGNNIDVEYRILHKEGQIVWVRSKANVLPVPDRPGAVYGYTIFTDITRRKRAEARYNSLFEEAAFGIYVTDIDGEILECNPAFAHILGYESVSVLKASIPNVKSLYVHPPQRDALQSWAMLPSNHFTNSEVEFYQRNGSAIWVSLNTRVVRDEHGQAVALESMMQDITARKQAQAHEQELAVERERVGVMQRFLRGAAHDLRTPLSIMSTTLYLLRKSTTDEIVQRRVDTLQVQLQHLEQSLDNLLRMSHLNRKTFQLQPIILNALVQDVVNEQRAYAAKRGLQIDFEPDTALTLVPVDPAEFKFALRQIIENACAHCATGKHIRVQTRLQDRQAAVSVIDDGDGISKDDLPHIFEPFYRAAAREPDKGGVGLGLTIAQWIIDAHEGDIKVESMLGKGSTFTLLLPVQHTEVTPSASPATMRTTAEAKALAVTASNVFDNPFLKIIMKHQPLVLVKLDAQGTIVGIDASEMVSSYSKVTQLVGQSVFKATAGQNEVSELLKLALDGEAVRIAAAGRGGVYEAFLQPFLDEKGNVTEIIGVALQTPEGQQEAEHVFYLAGLLEHISETIFLTDMYGTVVAWNHAAEKMLGWSEEEASGLPVHDLLGLRNTHSWHLQEGSSGEETVRTKSGALLDVLLTAAIIYDKQHKPIGIIGIIRDFGQRKQLERELRAAYEAEKELGQIKSQFVSIVSHEFRSPLASMMMSVDMLRSYSERMSPERRQDALDRIIEQINDLNLMIEELLLIAQTEKDAYRVERNPVDLIEFIHRLCEEINLTYQGANRVTSIIPPSPACIITDTRLLRQVLSNLLINALKYAREGTVSFEVAFESGSVCFRVRDQGIGIPAEDIPHLFEGFYRGGNVGAIPGTGLGLMIVKRAVDALGGKITVESEVGKGTAFTVIFPV